MRIQVKVGTFHAIEIELFSYMRGLTSIEPLLSVMFFFPKIKKIAQNLPNSLTQLLSFLLKLISIYKISTSSFIKKKYMSYLREIRNV